MSLEAMSIILYTALQTMQPCEKVFADTAKATNPTFKVEEQKYLDEFATAACATSNPDILWLLAYQETNFRFVIVRENHPTDFKITRGAEAIAVLKELKRKTLAKIPTSLNIDIGVMQFNWRWHGQGFKNDPMVAVSPKKQVQYFMDNYSRYIYDACEGTWVGCYHNQSNTKLSTKYQKDITKKTVKLTETSLDFLRHYRGLLNGEELTSLPPVVPQDIYKIFANTRKFPKPVKKTYDPALPDIASK